MEEVTPDLVARVRRLPTFLRAWNYAQDVSLLEDKTIYTALKIDKSQWTKIKKGKGSPPADERFMGFFDVVQNDVPLIWLAEARGFDFLSMRRHRSSLERENEELKQDLADHKRVIKILSKGGE